MAKKTSKATMAVKRFMAVGLALSMLFTCGISASAEPLDADTENTAETVKDGSPEENVSPKTDSETLEEPEAGGEEASDGNEAGKENADKNEADNKDSADDSENEAGGNEVSDRKEADKETADKKVVVNAEPVDNSVTDEEIEEESGIVALSDNSDEAEETDESVLEATGLEWSDEIPGMALFHNPGDTKAKFKLYILKDGKTEHTIDVTSYSQDVTCGCYYYIEDSATYTFQVERFGYDSETNENFSSGCMSAVSPEFVYTRPSEQVGVPSNIKWSADGIVSWDGVTHAGEYRVEIIGKKDNNESVISLGYVAETSIDCKRYLAEGYDYFVKVMAFSEDITQYTHGNWSDLIPFENNSSPTEGTDNKLDAAIGSDPITTGNVESIVEKVKNSFSDEVSKGELQVAMQTDSGIQAKIAELENTYSSAMNLNIVINSEVGTSNDQSSVKLLGAALNATQSGTITFNMYKPDEDTQKNLIANSQLSNAIAFDLELVGAGISRGAELAIPVTVTMKAPAGIDTKRMVVFHFHADNKGYETLPVRENADGTISFTVTHFSNFVFGEKTEDTETPDDGTNTGSSSSGAATSSNKRSSHVRSSDSSYVNEVPAWKPTTPDEKKRYAAMGKEKVEYTVSASGAYYVKMVNAMQGKLCFDVFEAVLKTLDGYKIGRTYNILPSGRNVYKMEQAATITLTIPKTLQAAGREFKMICVTKGGLPIVLSDTDSNPNTITFTTDSYYAFALIYKDVAAK